ncbi:MAG: hypothetical protein KDE29_20815, partial [Anaerolineales bacterium]|nr:hypothetical protein [Anaerolineales bacterium]
LCLPLVNKESRHPAIWRFVPGTSPGRERGIITHCTPTAKKEQEVRALGISPAPASANKTPK